MKKLNRIKCLKPNELAYLLLVSSVITGCSQQVQRLPNYQEALEHCKSTPEYCQESDKINQAITPSGASGSYGTAGNSQPGYYHENNSFLNYYLMYHMFFAHGYNVSPSYAQTRFSNYNPQDVNNRQSSYRGGGVYTPAFVSRMSSSIASGKTSFTTSEGTVIKSAQYAGSSRSSVTGKTISRGGFGSTGRGMGVSS